MSVARINKIQTVHYLRFHVTYSDSGIATGVSKQTLPKGAIITSSSVYINGSFNAATTNVLTVGTNGTTANNMVASGDVDETVATALTNAIKPTGTALGPLSADALVWVKYTQTGTAATAGDAYVVVHYVPDNDL